ncbi:MAG: glycosyltransferase family 4 protein [Chloroflexi bacterium]|nr:glycosyltransferase family 4 protein [Chloroflexota bacterium]
MRIALNVQLLSQAAGYRSGGINRVIYGLLGELARDPRGHRYDVFVPELPPRPERVDGAARGLDHVRFLITGPHTQRPSMRIAWEQSVLPMRLARLRPDLIHGLAYALPLAWPGPAVVTIFDLSFLRFPETLRRGSRLYLATATRLAARRARRIVTISGAIRSDIVRLLNVDPSKVEVAYPAVDERYRPAPRAELDAFRQARQLPDAFLFSLGTLEPRKNVVGLLEGYAGLPTPRPPLYLAGGEGWAYTPIFNRLRELRLERDVRLVGFVPETELPLWYNAARLFAYPSLYEGFGLPVLEAMACGTPVITSDVASLPEVGGKAALLVAPDDRLALTNALQRVLDDADLRRAMSAAGRVQASQFKWEAMVDRTVSAYNRAVADG